MTTILYPTRGADPTYRNQDRVIALAQERKAELLLLYVSSVRFLDRFASPVPVDLVQEELDELGQFLLTMAQERVEKAGVEAETAIRQGQFGQALKEIIKSRGVTVVVLGRPAQDTAITSVEYIDRLARQLLTESGTEVFVLDNGEIVTHLQPSQGAPEAQES